MPLSITECKVAADSRPPAWSPCKPEEVWSWKPGNSRFDTFAARQLHVSDNFTLVERSEFSAPDPPFPVRPSQVVHQVVRSHEIWEDRGMAGLAGHLPAESREVMESYN